MKLKRIILGTVIMCLSMNFIGCSKPKQVKNVSVDDIKGKYVCKDDKISRYIQIKEDAIKVKRAHVGAYLGHKQCSISGEGLGKYETKGKTAAAYYHVSFIAEKYKIYDSKGKVIVDIKKADDLDIEVSASLNEKMNTITLKTHKYKK